MRASVKLLVRLVLCITNLLLIDCFVVDSRYIGLDMLDNRFLSSLVKQNLSGACRRDTTNFLKSLNDFELWALKCEVFSKYFGGKL